MNRKWWQPHNPRSGILGVLHAIKNILVESLRRLLNGLGVNPEVWGKDLARRIVDTLVIVFAIVVVRWLMGHINAALAS